MNTEKRNPPGHPRKRPGETETAPVVSASVLFGAARALAIEHNGERYVLRITRNGRLILTK
ncbi:MAG: hemin uptake protein HemP [Gammaproteobacteria bacterium]|nr:hemin uptake protein HemP [Gammaproteobacteria bacterium]